MGKEERRKRESRKDGKRSRVIFQHFGDTDQKQLKHFGDTDQKQLINFRSELEKLIKIRDVFKHTSLYYFTIH